MAPIIYGAAIAYLLTPIVNFLERKIIFPIFEKRNKTLQKKGRKVVRWICVILSVFFMFLVIYALVMMILPQLIRSIMNIIYISLCKCSGKLVKLRRGKGMETESG